MPDGAELRPLSYANLSEWGPSIMSDGRILWTRSEYLDKGADFGHTLCGPFVRRHPSRLALRQRHAQLLHERPGGARHRRDCAVRPDLARGRLQWPHWPDRHGEGPFNPAAITNITPDVRPRYHMDWARTVCFRDPVPISRDYILVSHAPADRFGLYVIDRYGNRELLYLDPAIGSMSPTPLRPVPRPPVLPSVQQVTVAGPAEGQFVLSNVYQGLGAAVAPGEASNTCGCARNCGLIWSNCPAASTVRNIRPSRTTMPLRRTRSPARTAGRVSWPRAITASCLWKRTARPGFSPRRAKSSTSRCWTNT